MTLQTDWGSSCINKKAILDLVVLHRLLLYKSNNFSRTEFLTLSCIARKCFATTNNISLCTQTSCNSVSHDDGADYLVFFFVSSLTYSVELCSFYYCSKPWRNLTTALNTDFAPSYSSVWITFHCEKFWLRTEHESWWAYEGGRKLPAQ